MQGEPVIYPEVTDAIREAMAVLDFGKQKYKGRPFRQRPNPREEHTGKALGHVGKWMTGERVDSETGLHHLAHAIARLTLLLQHELEQAGKTSKG